MKKTILAALFAVLSMLGYRQYQFNLQVEWWARTSGLNYTCDQWEYYIPTMALAQKTAGQITNFSYKDWTNSIEKDRRSSCMEAHNWHEVSPEMPYTPKWREFVKVSGLSDIRGYVKDLSQAPFAVSDKPFDDKTPPTVRLKTSWYGGGVADCKVTYSEKLEGYPLPFLGRYVYALDCVNDKSKAEGVGGFIAASTSSNLEPIK